MAYDINYEDERFQDAEAEKKHALTENEEMYDGMVSDTDAYYNAQIDASKEWANTQTQLQQEQTDFAIEQIEQQKDQAEKDYKREQSGAYVDWQKQSNKYGVNSEQMAAQGLMNTGYSESSQVAMYNAYQNRVATARESYHNAVLNYNNAIKEARLQNSSVLAEIAYQSLQQQLELSLQGFQYKNQLLLDKANKAADIENTYHSRYLDVLDQMNYENSLAEEIRQYNQNYEMDQKRLEEEVRQYNQNYELELRKLEEEQRQFNESLQAKSTEDEQTNNEGIIRKETAEPVGAQVEIPPLEMNNGTLTNPVTSESVKIPFLSNMNKAIINLMNKSGSKVGAAPVQITTGENASKTTDMPKTADMLKNTNMPKTAQTVLNRLDSKRLSGDDVVSLSPTRIISTPYYSGAINRDTELYGTFANGYQPKGILGHGKLKKTGDFVEIATQTLDGKSKNVKQNIWKAEDGTLWYWEGRENKYKEVSE